MSLSDFTFLQKNNIIGMEENFFSDLRWKSDTVVQLYMLLLDAFPELLEGESKITSVDKFAQLLKLALRIEYGIVGYSD